jgi:hypothetical protein
MNKPCGICGGSHRVTLFDTHGVRGRFESPCPLCGYDLVKLENPVLGKKVMVKVDPPLDREEHVIGRVIDFGTAAVVIQPDGWQEGIWRVIDFCDVRAIHILETERKETIK